MDKKKLLLQKKQENFQIQKRRQNQMIEVAEFKSAQFPPRNQVSLNIVFPVTVDNQTKR